MRHCNQCASGSCTWKTVLVETSLDRNNTELRSPCCGMQRSGSSDCNTNIEERILSQRGHSEAAVDEGTASAHTVIDCREIIGQNMKNRLRTVELLFGGKQLSTGTLLGPYCSFTWSRTNSAVTILGRDMLEESYHSGSLYCPRNSLENKCSW